MISQPFRTIFLTSLLVLTAYNWANAADDASTTTMLTLENAWIAEAPPMSKVMAAYMDIQNPGAQAIEIETIASPDFSSIEIHRTVENNGVASMERLSSINIAAHNRFELKPGGYHLMMFNPKQPFKAGDSSQLMFTFSDDSTATFTVPVKKATGYANK